MSDELRGANPVCFAIGFTPAQRARALGYLRHLGYYPEEYSNGFDALHALKDRRPHSVLIDGGLSEKNATALDLIASIRAMKGIKPRIIVCVTDYKSAVAQKSMELRADALVPGPFNRISFDIVFSLPALPAEARTSDQ